MYQLMEVYERIKLLRKNHLKLTQEDFGNRLGVSRDTIGNIELNRLSRPNRKLSLIKLICKEFSVNEDWLLYGKEPMFIKPSTFSLDKFVTQHKVTELELQIVKAYFELDPDTRGMLIEHFRKSISIISKNPASNIPSTEKEPESKKSLCIDCWK